MNTHLKPEQMNDFLLGTAESETAAHLSGCPRCRADIEAMRRSLVSFRSAAIQWSEAAAKSVTLPDQRKARPAWTGPAWVMAAAVLILAIAIPFSVWHGRSNKVRAVADAQAQISRDNELLAHIESEVGATTPTPMQPLQINP